MRNLFAFDMGRKSEGKGKSVFDMVDGQKYHSPGVADRLKQLKERYQAELPPKNWADHLNMALYYIGRVCVSLLCFYPALLIVAVVCFFGWVSTNAPFSIFCLLAPALVLGAVTGICLLLTKPIQKRRSLVLSGLDMKAINAKYEAEAKRILKMPEETIKIDLLLYGYQWRGRKAVQRKTSRYGLAFENVEHQAYVVDKKLCLTEGHDLFEIPTVAIESITMLNERGRADLTRWNKPIPPKDPSFAPYKFRLGAGHTSLPMTALCQFEVKMKPENYCFYVPAYDMEALCKLLGRPAPKLNLPGKK